MSAIQNNKFALPSDTTHYARHFLYPSTLYVNKSPSLVSTVLGTCVSVCLWDAQQKIGGINHFMLPFWNGDDLASPKFGNIAMEKLVQGMFDNGSKRKNLQAKVFGGKDSVYGQKLHFRVGERNAELAIMVLEKEKIQIQSSSLGGPYGRKLHFFTDTGDVYLHFLKSY